MSDAKTILATYLTGNGGIDYSSLTDVAELKGHLSKNSKYPEIRKMIIARILEILPGLIPTADFYQLLSFVGDYQGYDEVNQLVKPAFLAALPAVLADISDLPKLVACGDYIRCIPEAKEMVSTRMDEVLAGLSDFSSLLSSYRRQDLCLSDLIQIAFQKRAGKILSSISNLSWLINYWQEDAKEFKIPGTVTDRQGALRGLIDERIRQVVSNITDVEVLMPLHKQASACLPIRIRIAQLLSESVPDTDSIARLMIYYKIVRSRCIEDTGIGRKAFRLVNAKMQAVLPKFLPVVSSLKSLAVYFHIIKGHISYDVEKGVEKRLIEVMEKKLPAISDINLLLYYSQKVGCYCQADSLIADRLEKVLAPIYFGFSHRNTNKIEDLIGFLEKAALESMVRNVIWTKGVNTAEDLGIDSLTVFWRWMHGSDIRKMMLDGATLRLAHNESEASDLKLLFDGYKKILGDPYNSAEIYDHEMKVLIKSYITKTFSSITKGNIPEAFLDIIEKGEIPESLKELFRNKARSII